eukprot:COSAG06_NODE_35208_length_462_cov_97.663912_1_plen_58_part_10
MLHRCASYRGFVVQIYEHERNLRRSQQQGYSTPYNTLFLAKSSAEDLSLSIFKIEISM